jgi:toxin ParE1/3/4
MGRASNRTLFVGLGHKRFEWLAKNSRAGRVRDDVGLGYRSYRQRSHLIFYIENKNFIAIIGIPHGSMDIDAFFQSPD